MTKETFIQSILRQFKDVKSPLRKLMLARGDINRKYFPHSSFRCSEFKLGLFVDTLDDESGRFQVIVQNESEIPPDSAWPALSEDLCLAETKRWSFVEEAVEFDDKYVCLKLHFSFLRFEPKSFDAQMVEAKCIQLKFDATNGQFTIPSDVAIFKNRIRTYYADPLWRYIEVGITDQFIDELKSHLQPHPLPEGQEFQIIRAFESNKIRTKTPTFLKIIEGLTTLTYENKMT